VRPPGRLNRKALAFESEIYRLHLDGHTSEAIRQALLDAGVAVSRSTVKREVARHEMRRQAAEARSAVVTLVSEPPALRSPSSISLLALAGDPRSSKEIAESFVKGRITNPLLRARITHESSSH
jgi:hypothetical protein